METLTDVNALQSFANICPALTGRVMTGDRPIGPSVFCRLFNRKKIIHPDIRNHLFPLVCTGRSVRKGRAASDGRLRPSRNAEESRSGILSDGRPILARSLRVALQRSMSLR